MKKRYIEHPQVRTFFAGQKAEVRAEYARYVYGLHAYEKKTREIPLHELALARRRMKEVG